MSELMRQADPAVLTNEIIDAATVLASKSKGSASAAEAKDFAGAVLAFAQSLAILDPTKDVNGVPLDHHEQLAKIGKAGPAQVAKRRRLRVHRDDSGRMAGIEEEN